MATHEKEKRTDIIYMKVLPSVKRMAEQRAESEGRSLSNYIERLILADNQKEQPRD